MRLEVISFFCCALNLFGFLLLLSNVERMHIFFRKLQVKHYILIFLGVVLVAQILKKLGIYMILVFAMEYIAILMWNGIQKKDTWELAFKGILCLIAMMASVACILVIRYYSYAVHSDGLMSADERVLNVCYLSMVMTQYLMIIFQELLKMKVGFKKTLMVTLATNAVAEVAFFYICISTSIFEEKYMSLSFLFLAAMLIDYIAFFVLILKLVEKTEQDKRADIHMNSYEYYLNMEEEHLLIRKMYHEMKNWLMIMEDKGEDLPKAEKSYIQSLAENLKNIDRFYSTGHSSLDMILYDGRLRAKERNIDFEAVVSEGCLDFMDEEDVNVLFSNAIINVIEACEKIVNGPRQIKIRAGENVNDTLIYFKNTVSQKREKGSFSTKKKNKIQHGIGMTSIRECVEKYDGYLSIIEEDSTFQLAILFSKE